MRVNVFKASDVPGACVDSGVSIAGNGYPLPSTSYSWRRGAILDDRSQEVADNNKIES